MTHSKLGSLIIVSVLILVVLAPVLTFASAPATAANTSDTADTYVVEQGGECILLEPHGDGTETVEAFYDYRTPYTDPSAWDYSSYGTEHLQDNQVSKVFVYEGAEGTSLVFLHDERSEDGEPQPYGSTITMQISDLPEGVWAVQDDTYQNDSQDDNWEIGDSSTTVDWMWQPDRSDGGAYRGLHGMDAEDAITVDPSFNEEADHWGEWNWSGDDDNRTERWVARSGDGTETELDTTEPITIQRGICGADETAPEANADVSPTTVAPGEDVTFDASESTDDLGVEGYEWEFGDGSEPATGETVTHAYAENGTYDATLTVTDGANNTDTATVPVTVEAEDTDAAPTAVLEAPESVMAGEPATFDARNSTDDEGIVSYQWTVDGASVDADGPTLERTFADAGTYTVGVTVVDGSDQTNATTTDVTVEAAPDEPPMAAASADPTTVAPGEPVAFDGTASTDDGEITAYEWGFGDGNASDGATASHAYASAGEYEATLTVTDDANNSADATVPVTVEAEETDDDSEDESGDDESDGSDDADDRDDSGDSDDADDSDDSDGPDETDDSGDDSPSSSPSDGSPSSGGSSGGTGGAAPPADESSSASVSQTDDGRLVVTVENAAEGEAVSADVPGDENATGLRSVELVPDTDADELNVTLSPSDDVSAPNGTDAGLYEVRTENGSTVRNVTYRFAVDRAAIGESGELRVLAGDGSNVTALNHTVVENGSTTVLDATTADVDRVVVAAVAPDVSATAIGTNGTATAGEPATVEATLANDGHLDANRTVNLTVDGAVVDSQTVTVRAGETANVSFETTFDAAGDARISVAGTEATITVASADGSTDTEGDTVTGGDAESSDTDTESTDAAPTSGQSTELALAGLGILVIGAVGLIRIL
ncbi:PKD repeat-containing protein [Halomicrobium zhouii]|uniref:PKD repeat-containing protein n=1 Tax=Halomicrobium zhouii TaxID=767519 RepID=A0A1I6M4Y4_9EURY|nr:PKD domain-containing protein [Halomicrobium zhouii]SFS10746.1 PKD repeat-containing protein [Halomicrobium zhouii]